MIFNSLSSKARIYILTFVTLCLVLISTHSFLSVPNIHDLASTYSSGHTAHPSWLLITSSASSDFQRRLLVRWTWVSLFGRFGIFDHIFAVSSTDPVLLPLIKKENDTFGDILLLDHIEDTAWTANRIKPFEFFKKVTNEGWKGKTYDFVSKVDQDSFVDPVRIWNKYLKGRVSGSRDEEDRLMLSMPHEAFCECPAPQGGFYTLSWDLAKVITRIYDGMEKTEEFGQEDCQIGRLPTDAGEQYEFVSMDREESFDVVGEKPNAIARDWSKEQVERGRLDKLENVAFLHQMKEEWKWLAVKDFFDEDGWVPNRSSGGSNLTSLETHTGLET
ncbi:hypothetical protein P7C71_g2913, partial [Lecanoromycetidae sp. Uapishka_2]